MGIFLDSYLIHIRQTFYKLILYLYSDEVSSAWSGLHESGMFLSILSSHPQVSLLSFFFNNFFPDVIS